MPCSEGGFRCGVQRALANEAFPPAGSRVIVAVSPQALLLSLLPTARQPANASASPAHEFCELGGCWWRAAGSNKAPKLPPVP